MAAFFLIILFFTAASMSAVSAQYNRGSNISLNSSLTPTGNSTWLSPSGMFAFGFFSPNDGTYAIGVFIAGIQDKTVVWTPENPAAPRDATMQLTSDGTLVLVVQNRQQSRRTVIGPPGGAIGAASMLDNGNFVLYNSNNLVIWQSFDYPTDTLLSGQQLLQPKELFSMAAKNSYTRGIFRLSMQSDGNLVQYPINTKNTYQFAYYASRTDGTGNNVSLNLENNGYIYLWNGSSILANLTTGYPPESSIYLLRIDADGIFRLYSHPTSREGNWTVKWRPNVDNCAPKGLCGFNSFCFLKDETAECRCLPGFSSVRADNRTAGCARNFTLETCGDKNGLKYAITREESTEWDNNPYETLNLMTEEACEAACLDDCNCDAAYYKDGVCSKQRTPLRFGRRTPGDLSYTLIKVGVPTTPNASGIGIKKQFRSDILGISIALIVAAVLVMAVSVIYVHSKHRNYKKITEQGEAVLDEDVAPRTFSYVDLFRATNNFAQELGKGGSSTVFKGTLDDTGKVVAVKRLEKNCGEGKEFQREVRTIGKTHHRNLVRLLGYSLDGPNRLLVFEYMTNGSLADILFNPEMRPRWEDRINIARDVARGILYLHEECETQIIHCDIKSQNVLMDEHGRARISDFGLAKLLNQDQTNTYTGVRGTKGYVAPEWHQRQPITVKADVYSFGIVLFEIICCRKSIDWNLSEDQAILEEWVYMCFSNGNLQDLVGDEMVDKRKLERILKVGLWCIQYDPSLRPSMKKVLLMLEGTVDIPVPPSPTSFLSSV
ncbi:G-type lectin S-receptor-like serine/threonine-protein kinase LECRK3 [Andrographis paniculata]|uniref:G-type lectin S-receptor-like serine/threonine-protein kinase LECRK3 n=1 Tax=Andrographis paniculata TaxID=175694 RepID=UPI0021E9552F|nr:G-type lectin S-receptor-like serine/threonine-protein kinase LECRK3 [Andrographis paniculata]